MARTKKKKPVKKNPKKNTRKAAAARRRVVKKATVRKTAKKKRTATSKVKKRRATPKKTIRRKTAPKRKKVAPRKKAAPKKKKTVTKKKIARKKTTKRKIAPKKTVRRKATPAKKAAAGKRAGARTAKRNQARIVKPQQGTDALKRGKAYQLQKGEDYMSTQQLKHFNRLLLNWKKELMKEVDRTVSHMQTDVTNFADPADRATQEEEFGLELRTRDRERKLIRKIDEALGMIGTEEYGYCNLCGAEIGIRRLEARPTATLCIDCKTLQEVRERQVVD